MARRWRWWRRIDFTVDRRSIDYCDCARASAPDAATVQIGSIMQVARLENEMACAIFELD